MDVLARARALAAAEVLGAVAAPARAVLAERARELALPPGATASTVRDGAPVALVVVDGEVDDGAGRHRPGAVLGLRGVVSDGATVTVVAAHTPSRLLELDADDLLDALAAHPEAAQAAARNLAIAPRSPARRWSLGLGMMAAPVAVALAGGALLALGPAAVTDHRGPLALALLAFTALLAWGLLARARGRHVRAEGLSPDAAAQARRARPAVTDTTVADLPLRTTAERAALARALAAALGPDELLAALAEDDDDDVQAAALRTLVAHARAGLAPPAALAERLLERERVATAMLSAARPGRDAGPALHAAEIERALRASLERMLGALALTAAAAGRAPAPVLVAGRRLLVAPRADHRRALDALARPVPLAANVRDTLARALAPSAGADRRAWSRLTPWLSGLLAGEHGVREPAIAALRAGRCFAALPGRHADDLAARAEHRFVAPGAVLVRRGEPRTAMIAVMSGALAVDEPATATLGPGDVLGERALVDDATWPATVRATTLAEVLVLDRPTFAAALVRWPELGVALCRGLVE